MGVERSGSIQRVPAPLGWKADLGNEWIGGDAGRWQRGLGGNQGWRSESETVRDDWVGYLGGTMTTLAFLPQVVKTLRTRDTRSISLGMYILFTTGVFLWLLYGLRLHALPMILANGLTLLMSFVLLVAKWRWK